MTGTQLRCRFYVGLAMSFLLASGAHALPRQSLTAGTPCIACHVNPTGGGGRTELGWQSMNHTGAFNFADLGLQSFHDVESNTLFDGQLALGFDIRVQGARLGNPTLDESGDEPETQVPDMTFFPMQFQPYVTVKPTDTVSLYATYLPGPDTMSEGKICDPVFPGTACYEGFVLYEPTGSWPTVRAGVFQPAIGVRHDDHTLFIRGDARDRRRPIIPPNYAELGAETMIQPVTWFRTELGVFDTSALDDTLNQASQTAELDSAAYSARVTFLPYIKIPIAKETETDEFDDFGDDFGDSDDSHENFVINSWFGASAYGSGDFTMLTGFIGLGIHEGVSFVGEVSHSQRTIEYETLNGWLGLWYTPWDWITTSFRVERAETTTANSTDETHSIVGGLEFFPIPFVEIRPEYRFVETAAYHFGQATVQLHLFY